MFNILRDNCNKSHKLSIYLIFFLVASDLQANFEMGKLEQ